MNNNNTTFLAGDFAKLHNVNKRTLHYYDEIGLFSPASRQENGYRCYASYQSAIFENILSLRELGVSIKELKTYLDFPTSEKFHEIASVQTAKIDKNIARLSALKKLLNTKTAMLDKSDKIFNGMIEIIECDERYLYMSQTASTEENSEIPAQDISEVLTHLKKVWAVSQQKLNCGSFTTAEKIYSGDYTSYSGLFTQTAQYKKGMVKLPKGRYLHCYCIGDWAQIPKHYEDIILYAKANGFTLTGYVFERGLNEFAIKGIDEYVTEISVLVQ